MTVSNDSDLHVARIMYVTMCGGAGGGCAGVLYSMAEGKIQEGGRFKIEVPDLCTGILGGLVAITAGCAWMLPRPSAAMFILARN